jgi:hypothetical protein
LERAGVENVALALMLFILILILIIQSRWRRKMRMRMKKLRRRAWRFFLTPDDRGRGFLCRPFFSDVRPAFSHHWITELAHVSPPPKTTSRM